MPVENTKLTKKTDLLKGAKLAKAPAKRRKIKPEEIDFSNTKQLAELLDITPELLDPSVKKPKFVKNDMLSATRIARALKLDPNMVMNEMQKFYKDGTLIRTDNGQEYNIVVVDHRVHHTSTNLRVHPRAIGFFLKKITSIKNTQDKVKSNMLSNEGR